MTRPTFDMSFSALMALARETLQSPRQTALKLVEIGLPNNALWLMLAIIVTLSAILSQISTWIVFPSAQSVDEMFLANPLIMAGAQWAVVVLTVYLVFWIGRAAGGTASFGAVLTLVTWLQFLMLCVSVAQTAALLILPGLAEMIMLVGFFLFVWIFTVFVATAHGFENLFGVFAAIVACTVVAVLVLAFILTALGVTVETGGNV